MAEIFKGFDRYWAKAKDAEDRATFETPDIPPGTYVARLHTVRYGSIKATGDAYVSFVFCILRGEYQGTYLSRMVVLADRTDRSGKIVSSKEEQYRRLSIDLQRLGVPTRDIDNEKALIGALDRLAKEHLSVKIRIKRWASGEGINVFIDRRLSEEIANNKLVAAEKTASGKQTLWTEDDNEPQQEETEDEDAGEVEGQVEEEEAADYPEEGDVVKWQAPRAKKKENFVVVSVDSESQTVELERISDSKRFKLVPWGHLEYVYEGDEESPF